jgi:hypothetical protein
VRLARDVLLHRHHRRVAEHDPGIDHAKGLAGAPCRVRHQPIHAVLGGGLADREQDPTELGVSPLEICRQPVVALDEACELVLPGDLHPHGQVAGRCAFHGLRHGPKRRREGAGEEVREQHRDDDRGGEDEDDHADEGRVQLAGARRLRAEQHEPESGEGQDRPGDEAEREARTEGHRRADSLRLLPGRRRASRGSSGVAHPAPGMPGAPATPGMPGVSRVTRR